MCKTASFVYEHVLSDKIVTIEMYFLFYADENTKVSKKNKKSPLINFFRRHRDDKNNNNSPPGKLFGHPLSDVVEGGLPHSVMVSLDFT